MRTKFIGILATVILGFVVFNLTSSKIEAGSCTYIGPNSGTWTAGANWSGTCAGIAGVPTDGDDVTIAGNTSTVNDLVSITLNTLNFTGSPGGTLTGGDIGITSAVTSSFPHVINVTIVLEGANVALSTNGYAGDVDLNGNNAIANPTVLPWGISGVAIGPGTITLNDADAVYLSGGASGAVTINASGETRVSLSGSGWSSSSQVTLDDGAMFFGEGGVINTIIGDGTATIRPTEEDGTTTNILAIDNYLGVNPGDTLSFRIAGTTPGSQHDQIFIDNSFEVAGSTLALSLAYTPTAGDTIVLLEAGDILGTFAGLPDGTIITVGGWFFQINYTSTQITLEVVDLVLQFVSFESDVTTAAPGAPVTITLVLNGNAGIPTGTVDFFSNGLAIGTATVDGAGVASITVNNLPSGLNSITADYSGDGTYPAATSGAAIDVTIAGVLASTGINIQIELMGLTLLLALCGVALYKKYEN